MSETLYRKTNLTLPPEVRAAFQAETDPDVRRTYARRLRDAGWTLQSISEAVGLTRERVRQIIAEPIADMEIRADMVIPEPPKHPERPKRVLIEPDPEKLARLLALQPLAQQVRSNSEKFRAEAEEYTALLNEVHTEDGVTLYRLAKRLGVSHGALRFRLARYGYKQPKTGESRVYTPILRENRAL